MRGSAGLDEVDLRLIAALQTSPRADWQRIGQVLEVSASTAARRWERLTDEGLAWLSCQPVRLPGTSAILAVIEVDCTAGRLHEVAVRIAEDSHVINVSYLTGARDLMIMAGFADQASLARYVGFRLGALDSVATTRTQIVTTIHTEGSRWRLDRLDEERRGTLLAGRTTGVPTRTGPDAADLALMTALSADCRQPAAVLAERLGLSTTSVRRRLARLDAGRFMVYRCEVARFISGWPIGATLWSAVSPARAEQIAAQLVGMRETRMCLSLSGPYNLVFAVWLRAMNDVQPFEFRLVQRIPDLVIADRAVNLWHVKLGGHLLDPQGRHLRAVPVALWSDGDAAAAEAAVVRRLRHP